MLPHLHHSIFYFILLSSSSHHLRLYLLIVAVRCAREPVRSTGGPPGGPTGISPPPGRGGAHLP